MTEIKGLFTALLTPFTDNAVDEDTYAAFIDWQISEGVHGLVPVGTTGESPTLTHEEHKHVVELCVKAAAGRAHVMAGTGSNSTDEAVDFTRHAKEVGADSALIVTPYYNKPTPEGIYQHFKAINDAVDIPLIVYNIPGRSVINISDGLFERLAELPNVAGVKDATGDLARVSTLRHLVGDRFALLSGEDMTAVGFNAQGGQGCISVTANIAPKRCAEIQNACLAGDYAEALRLHETLVGLHTSMFLETNPVPVKYAAHLMGKCSDEIRLPLTLPEADTQARVKQAMQSFGLL